MSRISFKNYSKWLSQISAAASLIILVFVKSKFIFESGNTAVKLIWILMIAALFTVVFGVVSLPRWQGFVALGIFSFVIYSILFTPIYAIS